MVKKIGNPVWKLNIEIAALKMLGNW